MKIENKEKFENGLENFNLLRNSAGCINEEIILFCDNFRLTENNIQFNLLLPHLENFLNSILFNNFGIKPNKKFSSKFLNFFGNNRPNYYTIKEFIIQTISGIYLNLNEDKETLKEAVFLLLKTTENRNLVVSRRHSAMVGLPGGKVDKDETKIEALFREIKEETNYNLDYLNNKPILIFSSIVNDFISYTYTLLDSNGKVFRINEDLDKYNIKKMEEGININIVNDIDLLEFSEYSKYNSMVLDSYKNLEQLLKNKGA